MNTQKRRNSAPKGIIWYLEEHPDLLQRYTDIPSLLRRIVRFFKKKREQARMALRYMGRERLARRFPESDHRLAQAVLFIWGNIPALPAGFGSGCTAFAGSASVPAASGALCLSG